MRRLICAVAAVVIVAITPAMAAPIYSGHWVAKDGAVIDVWGSPSGEEWEATVNQAESCIPTGPIGHALLQLHCGDAVDDMTKAKGGVIFRGKFYATAK